MTLAITQSPRVQCAPTLLGNWRIYAMDGALLGVFMISACIFATLLEHPSSPLRQTIHSTLLRRGLVGLAMGATAVALIYSPWGKRTGAQMNPATTLSFLRLGRISPRDAAGYIVAQFVGGAVGVAVMTLLIGNWIDHPSIDYVATKPGGFGLAAAWLGEFIIAALLMTVVLTVNRLPRLSAFAGCFAGLLVTLYITFEAPLSGMSLNPARTFSSSLFANNWTGWWIYLTAPICGMLAAIELQRAVGANQNHICGKYTHSSAVSCFIHCDCGIEGQTQRGNS
jgi:aquaporin Z